MTTPPTQAAGYPVVDFIEGNLNIVDVPGGNGTYGNLTVQRLFTAVQAGLIPSGDQTGAADTATILGLRNLGAAVTLGPGDFYISVSALLSFGPGQGLRGAGPGQTRIFAVGGTAGQAAITFRNPSFPTSGDPFAKTNLALPSGGFLLDGSLATAGVNGIEVGDLYLVNLTHVEIANFNKGAGAIGLYFCNRIGWTERAHVRAYIDNCDVAVAFDVQGGTNSFAYSDEIISVHQAANQNGFSWRNGANVYGGQHHFTGNFAGGVSNTGVAVDFGTDNSAVHFASDAASIVFETNGSGVSHKSVNIGTSGDLRVDRLIFRGGLAWTAGSLTFSNINLIRAQLEILEPTLGNAIPKLMKHANVTVLPSATANTFGAFVTETPDGRWQSFIINGFSWTPNGTAGETITLQLTFTWSDGSTTTFSPPGVVGTSGSQSMSTQQMSNFYKPGVALVQFQVQSESTIGSSTATPTFTMYGENRT